MVEKRYKVTILLDTVLKDKEDIERRLSQILEPDFGFNPKLTEVEFVSEREM